MRKTHGRSIALGIGIGMIITSIAGMIFTNGTQKEMTKEEIITLAKSYGMIEKTPLIIPGENSSTSAISENSTSASNSTIDASIESTKDSSMDSLKNSSKDSSKESSVTSTSNEGATGTSIDKSPASSDESAQNNSSVSNQRNIQIVILNGAKSQHVIEELLEKGVITSERDMVATFNKYNATTKINVGKFMFKKNEDLDYIVKTICGIK